MYANTGNEVSTDGVVFTAFPAAPLTSSAQDVSTIVTLPDSGSSLVETLDTEETTTGLFSKLHLKTQEEVSKAVLVLSNKTLAREGFDASSGLGANRLNDFNESLASPHHDETPGEYTSKISVVRQPSLHDTIKSQSHELNIANKTILSSDKILTRPPGTKGTQATSGDRKSVVQVIEVSADHEVRVSPNNTISLALPKADHFDGKPLLKNDSGTNVPDPHSSTKSAGKSSEKAAYHRKSSTGE